MIGLGLLTICVFAVEDPGPAAPGAEELASYRAAAAEAGRDADAHVALALWCERLGLEGPRGEHLAIAAALEPGHTLAEALMGRLRVGDRWVRPEDAAEAEGPAVLEAMAEYVGRRDRADMTADDQWRLALWCERNGLEPEADAHLQQVVRLDPGRTAAWHHLGYERHGSRWMTPEQIEDAEAEAEAQRAANQRWSEALTRWRRDLRGDDPEDRAAAEQGLAAVDDPRAVPAIWRIFVEKARHEADLGDAVLLLGQIDARSASRALAALAVFADPPEVRDRAVAILAGRDPREFADLLIPLIRDPLRYAIRPVGGPGSPGALFVEGEQFRLQELYTAPALTFPLMPGDTFGYDENGLPVVQRSASTMSLPRASTAVARSRSERLVADARNFGDALTASGVDPSLSAALVGPYTSFVLQDGRPLTDPRFSTGLGIVSTTVERIPVGRMAAEVGAAAMASERQLEADVAALARINAQIELRNGRVVPLLEAVSGQRLGADREAWVSWFTDQLGFSYRPPPRRPKPTYSYVKPPAYVPVVPPVSVQRSYSEVPFVVRTMSCFGAGTLVWTRGGPRPIEELAVGDLVLAQDPETGTLGYRAVLRTHHNPPSETLTVRLDDGEAVIASLFHRFWRVGRGWAQARDLKPGDRIRTVGSVATIASVEPGATMPVYNLDVADDHTFFVGAAGYLVHDNGVPDFRARPFDAADPPEAIASRVPIPAAD